jgi:hypothetical protein
MLPDASFLTAFFSLTLPNSAFHHRDHLRLAWLAARRHGVESAESIVTSGIRRLRSTTVKRRSTTTR